VSDTADAGDPSRRGSERGSAPGRARAVVRVRVDDPATVAAALAPDDTPEVTTGVDGDHVVARIERPDAGGLRGTADDYVRNLQVATQLPNDTTHP